MNRPEQALHKAIAQYLRAAHPRLLWWHTPNGGSRNVVEAAILKSMGTLAGVPDLVFVLPGGSVGFMEIKAGKGALSAEQKAFAERACEAGAAWALVRSVEEVQDHLRSWLRPEAAPDAVRSRAKLPSAGDCSRGYAANIRTEQERRSGIDGSVNADAGAKR